MAVEVHGLCQVNMPEAVEREECQVPILCSPNIHSYDHVLILIQGNGEVMPGTWSRYLLMNKTEDGRPIDLGSMLPQIEYAKSKGMGIVILNPNYEVDKAGLRPPEHVSGH